MKGIRGVFIASQLFENFTRMSKRLGPEHLTSLITFDQGGEWASIKAPRLDSNGRKTNCNLVFIFRFNKQVCNIYYDVKRV